MEDILKELKRVSFGEKLAEARKAKKLSMRKLALMSGLSATYISYLERGKQGPPSLETTIKLAEVLECDTDEFLAEAGHVSEEVSKAYQKNPKEVSEAARDSFTNKGLGIVLGIALLFLAMKGGLNFEDEELPEPEEAFKQLKEAYLEDEIPIDKEKEYFDYCKTILKCWKIDLEQREKESK